MFRRRSAPPPREPGSTSVTERMPVAEEEYGYVEEPVVEEEIVEAPLPRRPPLLWPYLLALLVLVLAGLAALWYFTRDTGPAQKPVPAVVRLPEGDAVQVLRNDGFQVQIERRRSDEAPQGIVFAQRPGAGRKLDTGSVVTILVSKGPASAQVPDVTGLPADRAEKLLADAGFKVKRAEVFSEKPPGTIVAQDPAAGQKAPLDSPVRINVSRGTGRVKVPDVVGRTAAEAGSILRRAGLETPNVVSVPSDLPANEVVAQSPPAGTEVRKGTKIRINVSNGKGAGSSGGTTTGATTTGATTTTAGTALPDAVGLPENEALQALQAAGATVTVGRQDVTDPAEDGVVLRQVPPGGQTIEPGQRVRIVVGRLAQ
jgi:serine/threonine-protein kinase